MDPSIDSSSNDTIKNKNTTISSPNSVKAQGYIEKSESEYQSEALEQAFQTILNVIYYNIVKIYHFINIFTISLYIQILVYRNY